MTARTALVMVSGQVQQLPAGDNLAGALAASAAGGVASSGTFSFANSNGVSFGMAGQTLTASVAAGPAAGIAAISAGTQQQTSGTMILADANGLSFGMSGSSQITAKMPSVSYWENFEKNLVANAMQASSNAVNLSIQRIEFPFQISATLADLLAHLTVVGSTAGSYSLFLGLYTMAGSTASLASSASVGVSWNSGTNSTAASIYGAHSGTRWRSVPISTWNVTPGEYLLAAMGSIAGPAGTTGSITAFGGSSLNVLQGVGLSGNHSAYFADGVFSVGTAAMPASLHLSAIVQTGTAALRQPYVRLLGSF